MWYRYSSNKNILNKYNLSSLQNDDKWFESVPQNIWTLIGTKIKIKKLLYLDKNTPKSNFIIYKNDKEIGKCETIEEALEKSEKYNA